MSGSIVAGIMTDASLTQNGLFFFFVYPGIFHPTTTNAAPACLPACVHCFLLPPTPEAGSYEDEQYSPSACRVSWIANVAIEMAIFYMIFGKKDQEKLEMTVMHCATGREAWMPTAAITVYRAPSWYTLSPYRKAFLYHKRGITFDDSAKIDLFRSSQPCISSPFKRFKTFSPRKQTEKKIMFFSLSFSLGMFIFVSSVFFLSLTLRNLIKAKP